MKFEIGDNIIVSGRINNETTSFKGLKGEIIAVNAKSRYLIEFKVRIGSHSLYGIGKNGYCFMLDEDVIKKISFDTMFSIGDIIEIAKGSRGFANGAKVKITKMTYSHKQFGSDDCFVMH